MTAAVDGSGSRRVDGFVNKTEGHNTLAGRAVGFDFAMVGLPMPEEAAGEFAAGYREGMHSRGGRRPTATSVWERKLLRLRYSAWKRDRLVDEHLTPAYLAKIFEATHCPVTMEVLTRGTNSGTDSTVDRVFNGGAYAAGNVAVMCKRANQAKADRSPAQIWEIADARVALDGLEPDEWVRLAALCSLCTPDGYQQVIRPLLVWPPLGLLISNGYAMLMMIISLAAAGSVHVSDWTALRATASGKKAKAALDDVFAVLRAQIARAKMSQPAGVPPYWAAEQAWKAELVWVRMQKLLKVMPTADVRSMIEVSKRVMSAHMRDLSTEAIEGWSTETNGYDKEA